jgi:hypothetical protein
MALLTSYLVLVACCVFLRAAWSALARPRQGWGRPSALLLTEGISGADLSRCAPADRSDPVRLGLAIEQRRYDGWCWGTAGDLPRAAPAVLTSLFVLLDLSQPSAHGETRGLTGWALDAPERGGSPFEVLLHFAEPATDFGAPWIAPAEEPWSLDHFGGASGAAVAHDGWFV